MKILFLIQSLDKSGAPKSLSLVANHFDGSGHDVSIFTESESIEIFLNHNIKIINDSGSRKKIFGRLKILNYIKNLKKVNQYDVVITFIPLYILAFLKSKSLLIFSDRGLDTHKKAFLIYRMLAKCCDFVVLQTPYASSNYPNLNITQIRIIPNAILPLGFEVIPYSIRKVTEGKISCSGRLFIRQKRQDILIKAMEHVHTEYPNACLYIYGDGPDKSVLEQMIIDQNAGDYVKLEGFSNDIARDLFDSEIFVLSSDYEGLPNSLIEAMQLGLPCISTDCSPGGARYLLEKNNGIIVERENYKELADQICFLLENKEERYLFAARGKNRVTEFSGDAIFRNWNELVENDK